ncbi:SDR family oxidoreductase [Microbacterium sp. X-17]|uniref:SDR family NAD(P)-dependent oxidoreductase n=1 Tax=Microbacterium sp. X-17 TaxID=3144404 RepID=UPI0031F591CA
MSDFEGLVAAVTGGASGLGKAIADELASHGARVYALDLDASTVTAPHTGIRCDIGDDESVRAAIAEVVADAGRLDVVIANAGIGAQGDVEANDDAEWARVLNVNVIGSARTIRHAMPHLKASPSPAVVLTSSIAAAAGLPQRVLYSASKGAISAMTLAIAADCLPFGIRVNAVAPGTADTPWVGRLLDSAADPDAERAALEARQPSGRLVRPQEVADAVAYLASPRSASTNGVILAVDGGMYSLRPRR